MTLDERDNPAIERRMLFALDGAGEDHFTAQPIPSRLLRLYGGQVFAQALAAAQRTVADNRPAHSCHGYFLSPGATDMPLSFTVMRDRDGRSFSARRVLVEQNGRLILSLSASFQDEEDSARHQQVLPDVAPPETLEPMEDYIAEFGDALPTRHLPFWGRSHLVDWRPVEPFRIASGRTTSARRHFWMKLKTALPADAGNAVHQRYLAYASDLHILHSGLAPLGIGWADPHLQTSTLDHSIWFHDRFHVDDWLLYVLDSPAATGARALGLGNIFTREGRLVATVAQQGLVRMLDAPRTDAL